MHGVGVVTHGVDTERKAVESSELALRAINALKDLAFQQKASSQAQKRIHKLWIGSGTGSHHGQRMSRERFRSWRGMVWLWVSRASEVTSGASLPANK